MLEEERNLAIVSWNTAGTSFEIHNEVLFAEDLLPHYFKHSNFASFIRQVPPRPLSSTCTTSTRGKLLLETLSFSISFSEGTTGKASLMKRVANRHQTQA